MAGVAVVGFAATFVVGGALTKVHGVSPMALTLLRFAAAGGAMMAWACASREGRERTFAKPGLRDWLTFAVLGPVGTAVMAVCVFEGCARVGTANASMADALAPLFMCMAGMVQERKAGWRQLAGMGLGFLGALLTIGVVGRDGVALEAYTEGDLYVLAAAVAWAAYSVFGRGCIGRVGAVAYTTWTMAAGVAFCAAMLPWGEWRWPAGGEAWGLTALLAGGCTLLPFWAWNAAQKYLPTGALGVSAYFTPVCAVALAAAFCGESAGWEQWAGTGLVCAAALAEKGGEE